MIRRILLTNDDGLTSNGMVHLEEELAKYYEVWAIAPDRERSATSHALSIRDSLRLIYVRPRHFMLSGFPADCINISLNTGRFPEFDLVISGINHGVNLGDDVHFSGTVGAARHAALNGIKAIAVSTPIPDHNADFRRIARFIRTWVEENEGRMKTGLVYNINYPLENSDIDMKAPFPEERITSQGKRVYLDEYETMEEGQNYTIYRMKSTVMGRIEEEGSDFHAIENGLVSITPLSLSTTHNEEKQKWLKVNEKK